MLHVVFSNGKIGQPQQPGLDRPARVVPEHQAAEAPLAVASGRPTERDLHPGVQGGKRLSIDQLLAGRCWCHVAGQHEFIEFYEKKNMQNDFMLLELKKKKNSFTPNVQGAPKFSLKKAKRAKAGNVRYRRQLG